MTLIEENQTSRNSFRSMQEPTGFVIDSSTGEVKRDDSALSWSNGARQFTIIPKAPATSYIIYIEGVKHEVTSTKNVIITDTEGLWFFYLDNTLTLQATQTFDIDFIYSQGYVAVGYWDATNNRMLFDDVFDERHGCKMDGHTHSWIHQQAGTRYQSGLALTNFSVDGSGDLDIHAQFGSDVGVIYDEDLKFDLSAVLSSAGLPILYHEASGVWRQTTNAGFSVLTTGSGRLAYNPAGSGLLELTNNDFVNCHVFATSGIDVDGTIAAIVGQVDYGNLNQAREGAANEIDVLILAGLPVQEFKFIGTVIFQTNNGYGNAVKGRVRSTDLGDDYIDFRRSDITAAGSTGAIHNSFADNDHLQYLDITGTILNQHIPNTTTAVTQLPGNESGEIATTLFVARAIGDEAHIYYVKSNGTDLDDGLNISSAFLTIQKGINTAFSQTPTSTNQYVIRVQDGGSYGLFNLSSKPYIQIQAKGSQFQVTGTIVIGADNSIFFDKAAYISGSGILFTKGGAGTSYLNGNEIFGNTTTVAIEVTTGTLYANVDNFNILNTNAAVITRNGTTLFLNSSNINGKIIVDSTSTATIVTHNLDGDIDVEANSTLTITANGLFTGDIIAAAGATINMEVGSRSAHSDSIADGATVDISYIGQGTESQRNLLVGGDYRVNPRQATPVGVLGVAQSNDTYIADNTIILSDGFQIVAVAAPVLPDRNLVLTIATANKQFGILLPIENSDAEEVIGGTASMSFRAGWTAIGTHNLRAALISWDGTADAITTDAVSSWTATPTLIANWTYENTPSNLGFTSVGEFKTFKIENIPVDTANTTNIAMFVWMSDTTSATGEKLEFSNIRCNKGAFVEEFAPRSYAEEVSLCQRYYSKSYDMGTQPQTVTYEGCQTADKGAAATTGFAGMNIRFPTPMMKIPTVTPYPTTTTSSGTITLHTGFTSASSSIYVTVQSAVIKRNSNVSGTYQAFFHWVADARF